MSRKLVVFDVSAKLNSVAINVDMYAGPKLQNNLQHILLLCCWNKVAVAAAVAEMFLQVELQPSDRRCYPILWKSGPQSPIEVLIYEFCCLFFGRRVSSYLAGKALRATSDHFDKNAAQQTQVAIANDFYIDDLLSSIPSENSAIRTRQGIQDTHKSGRFNTQK